MPLCYDIRLCPVLDMPYMPLCYDIRLCPVLDMPYMPLLCFYSKKEPILMPIFQVLEPSTISTSVQQVIISEIEPFK